MLPPNWDEPKNICTICGKWWEGNPYEYETDDHDFPCPECAGEDMKVIDEKPLTDHDLAYMTKKL